MCKDFDLKQAMDYNYTTKQIMNKNRGFVNVLVAIDGVHFVIPLRSNMPKNYQLKYKLRDSKNKGYVEGLDFGKALILENDSYIVSNHFKMRQIEDYFNLMDNAQYIISKFRKHIVDFNQAVENSDVNKLTDPMRFKFCTFVNYIERIKHII
ncbi:hypothetical protein KBI51_08910 [Aerococcaceae bacterium zg-ZUI334]|nr:hypothetical protein [Aerococcaceae bacterium zg-ZUI334]MBS4462764.1 hypothetical protein [Aerococcaceae bacterium zg-B36]NEW65314.1 hypothetical protein [Facklamia sp. 252]NEW68334.1 hypothetical protein [Facklamia sp. 253]QQD66486.1 hypothetical protein JDW14_03350 [Aerococcaceae bacterium zg-252]